MIDYNRQFDLVKCDMTTPITVVGAGGIGSFTVLTLAKMGFQNITVYDFDKVEAHNLPNQFYRLADIGQLKVDALADIVRAFTDIVIEPVPAKLDVEDFKTWTPEVLVSAVDNMATRKQLYDAYCAEDPIKVFIDGRMGADQAEVYTITGEPARSAYEERLWTDAEAAQVPCTSRATMYNVLTIASLIANQTRLALMGEPTEWAVIVDNKNIRMHYVR